MRVKARASHCLREFGQVKMCSGAISSVTEFLSLPWDLSSLLSFVLGHMCLCCCFIRLHCLFR